MLVVGLVVFLISTCLCEVDFNERPRNFSLELLYHTQSETNGHIVISPFGIWTLMTGVALGTTGDSYNQLAHAFILPNNSKTLIQDYKDLTNVVLSPPSSSGVSLTSKNIVFLNNELTVRPQFKDTLQNDFATSMKVLDCKDSNSARIANTSNAKSGGKVPSVLLSNDFQESRMILTNVISFKGLWASPFNVSETVPEPFYNEHKEVIGTVNMMNQKKHFPFSSITALKSQVLELPYGTDNKYSMIIALPFKNRKDVNISISEIYRNMASYSLKNLFDQIMSDEENYYGAPEVEVKIPRFKITNNLILNKPLNKMGVVDIFQPDLASFQRVSQDSTFASAVVHKVDIEVTESGMVGSGKSTGMVGSGDSSITYPDWGATPLFYCNRPFVYFVIEKTTTTVLISGIYSIPTMY